MAWPEHAAAGCEALSEKRDRFVTPTRPHERRRIVVQRVESVAVLRSEHGSSALPCLKGQSDCLGISSCPVEQGVLQQVRLCGKRSGIVRPERLAPQGHGPPQVLLRLGKVAELE